MTTTATSSSVERATAVTEDLIDRGAPWSPDTSWQIILTEGVVVAILGLMVLFRPFGGASITLQLLGLTLLGGALVTTFQLWRGKVSPERTVLAAFRAGSGVTVGVLVLVATFLTSVTDAVTASLSAAVGVGFIVFGLVGVAMALTARAPGRRQPPIALVVDGTLTGAGVVLTLSGALGADAVDWIFNILGIVLIVAGVALGGYAYLLRQRQAPPAAAA